jgi:hypothetical protein
MDNHLTELLADFNKEKSEVDEKFRKGTITDYEYSVELVDLYNEYANIIGLHVIYINRK